MSHWIKSLAKDVPWQLAYPAVAEAARVALSGITPDKAIGTAALVALLWPGQGPRDAIGKAAMTRIYQALKALANHDLSDCVTRGEPETSRWGTSIRRSYWHAPVAATAAQDRETRLEQLKRDNPEIYEQYYGGKK